MSDELHDTYHCTLLFLSYCRHLSIFQAKSKYIYIINVEDNDNSIQLDIQYNVYHLNTVALKKYVRPFRKQIHFWLHIRSVSLFLDTSNVFTTIHS